LCNLMYNSAYNKKQHVVAECYFICSTNLSLSWHHSLQGACFSSILAGSETIPRREAHLSVSRLAGGRRLARRGSKRFNRIQIPSRSRYKFQLLCMNLQDPNTLFLLNIRNTISDSTDFSDGTACSTVRMYTTQVVYFRNHSMGERR